MTRPIFAALLIALSIVPGAAGAQSGKPAVEAAVRRMINGANRASLEAVLAEFAPNAEMLDGGVRHPNLNAIRNAYGPVYSNLRSQNLRVDRFNTQMVAPKLAVYTASGSFTSTDRAGVSTPRRGFAWTMVWRQAEDGWKAAHVHQSLSDGPTSVVQQTGRRVVDQTAVRQVVAAYAAAVNARDAVSLAALFTENGDQIIVDGPLLVGRVAIRADAMNALASMPTTQKFTLGVTGVRMLGQDMALVETFATFSEGPMRANRGTLLMEREGNRWLISSLRVFPAQR